MRGRRARTFIVAAAAAALAGAIALPASSAGAAGAASISATPATNLSDGDSVAVSVTGIPAATTHVYIWECNGDTSITYDVAVHSCKGLTDGAVSNGAFSTSATMVYGYFFNGSGPHCDETASGQCVLAALDYSANAVIATTPISFKAPSVSMTVTPDTGLKDGQKITVTVDPSTIPPSVKPLSVAECNTSYMATHGGFGSGDGCDFARSWDIDATKPLTLTVVDGPSGNGKTACNYGNNGDCAIVLLGGNNYSTVATHPISFRAPVRGPATIAATPTTDLHDGTPGTVSLTSGFVADGFSVADVMECRPAALAKYADGDWGYMACGQIGSVSVVDNRFAPQKVQYHEGGVGGTGSKNCDHATSCVILLAGQLDNNKYVRLSNLIPITFRPPNFGTPTIKLSKTSGLSGGQTVNMTVTDVPDLVRALDFYECNIKRGYNKFLCHSVHATPGDQGALIVHDNKTQGSTKVRAGVVGTTNSGKKVYCNAHTNGQCVLVAITYPNYEYRIQSPVIKFAP